MGNKFFIIYHGLRLGYFLRSSCIRFKSFWILAFLTDKINFSFSRFFSNFRSFLLPYGNTANFQRRENIIEIPAFFKFQIFSQIIRSNASNRINKKIYFECFSSVCWETGNIISISAKPTHVAHCTQAHIYSNNGWMSISV